MVILGIIYIIFLALICLTFIVCMKIRMAGMTVKDFIKFILAIDDLDNLYVYSSQNKKMTKNEKTVFLRQAEKVFSIFEKIPSIIWEDEYDKYEKVLQTYRDIRVSMWTEAQA